MQSKLILAGFCFIFLSLTQLLFSQIIAQTANKEPVAKITGTKTKKLPASSTILYGTRSKDEDGKIVAYQWQKVSGPSSFKMTGADKASVFISMSVGIYVFQLTVTDDKGATNSAQVTVSLYGSNKDPKAVITGTSIISASDTKLYGTTSSDADGNIISYAWKYISGPTGFNGSGYDTDELSLTGLADGVYVFQLTVTDNNGATNSTNFTFKKATGVNQAPKAIITGTTSLILPVNFTTLYATSSTDDKKINSYNWKRVSGPPYFKLSGENSNTLIISGLVVGTYIFQLTVTDEEGLSNTATVTISQLAAGGSSGKGPRIIITGLKTLLLPSNTTKLDASGSYDENGGNIIKYTWSYISGPDQYKMINSDKSILTLDNLIEGTYKFQLYVVDDKGIMRAQLATVIVKPAILGSADCGCTKMLEPSSDNSINLDGNRINAKPGDVICIKAAKYRFISLRNFQGTSDKPIIFKNCGGQVSISGYTAYAILLSNSSYYRFTGTGSSDYVYGFTSTTPTPGQFLGGPLTVGYLSSNFEIDHVELSWSPVGVYCKTELSCDTNTWGNTYTMRNVKLHNINVHNSRGEGYYIGYAKDQRTLTCNLKEYVVPTQKIENLEIYNCIADQTGWDGIQVASIPVNCKVHDNKVTNFGLVNLNTQEYGILFGGNCSGAVYNNTILNGTGAGIGCLGKEKISIYNNVIYNVGFDNTTYGQDGIFIDDRSEIGTKPVSLFVANNTIVHARRNGVTFMNSRKNIGTSNYFYNNLTVDPGSYNSFKNEYYKSSVNIANKTVTVNYSNNLAYKNISDGKFVNAAGLNFQLTSKSPAYNTGRDLTGLGLTTDMLGVKRPQYGNYDVGAYESTASSASTREKQNGLVIEDLTTKMLITKPGLTLAPVPAKDVLNVYISNNYKGKLQLNILDANGKTIAIKNNLYKDTENFHTTINVGTYIGGLYYLKVSSIDAEQLNDKFIVIK